MGRKESSGAAAMIDEEINHIMFQIEDVISAKR